MGNAKVEGLEADLNMTGNDYNLVNMIFVSLSSARGASGESHVIARHPLT